jgi:hypothetical protein
MARDCIAVQLKEDERPAAVLLNDADLGVPAFERARTLKGLHGLLCYFPHIVWG